MLPQMTDAFADVVMPIFQKVLQLLDRLFLGETRSPDEVMAQTQSWIEEAARKTLAKPDLARSFELAKFGLVTWIDEILTDSAWGTAARWSVGVHLLEWSIYGTRVGASRFYDEARRAEDEGDIDALEVYLLCVTLGFKGIMAYDETELAEWVERVYGRVSEAGSVASRPFSEEDSSGSRFGPLRGPSLLITVSILVAITSLFTLAAYLLAVHLDYYSGG
jgi:type VI secretion system protein ImpK